MPSRQATFNRIVSHLRRQGTKAESRELTTQVIACMYRTPDGRRCAVGCLIPDNRYDPAFEQTGVGGMNEADGERDNDVTLLMLELGHDLELLIDFQAIHDTRTVNQWEPEFQKLAERRGLKYKPPNPLKL